VSVMRNWFEMVGRSAGTPGCVRVEAMVDCVLVLVPWDQGCCGGDDTLGFASTCLYVPWGGCYCLAMWWDGQ